MDGSDHDAGPPKKKRKMTKAQEAKLKAQEKAKAKKKGIVESDSDEEDEEDPYKAPSKGLMADATSQSAPAIGTFESCVECKKKFTVVCFFYYYFQ